MLRRGVATFLLLLVFDSRVPAAGGLRLAVAARVLRPGELAVLTVTTATPAERVRVRVFDRDVPAFKLDRLRWRALVGIDLDVRPGVYRLSVEAADGGPTARARRNLRVLAHRFPTRALTVDEAFVNPPADVAARIAREADELVRLWNQPAGERQWSGAFVRPVPGAAVSGFGTRSLFNGQPRNPHGGGDFAGAEDTPVHAPNAGRVVLARALYFSGNTVIVDHGLGLFSLLAHLSRFGVSEGDEVKAGQIVGRVGATGRVTGPHLHWAVRVNGARVDPTSLLVLLGREQD